MKREQILKTLKTLVPAELKITEETLDKADAVLADNSAVITYLRGPRKVDRVLVVGNDTPPKTKLIICSGEPKAVLLAFVADEKLYISWAKRNEDTVLMKNAAYEKLVKDIAGAKDENIYKYLQDFARSAVLKDKETAFSKEIGRYIAYLTAGTEVLTFERRRVVSTRCGNVPDLIAKALPTFIARAERMSGLKASNIIYESLAMVAGA